MSTEQIRPGRRYVLITPCRDEAAYARRCIESVLAQSLPPSLWVIVDDGSSDATGSILLEYAQKVPWIRVLVLRNRGKRQVGPGVVEAFYAGLDTVSLDDFDYLCKFDLDLEIPAQYFHVMVSRMEREPRLGTCSGKPYFEHQGRLISERCGDEMSVGMSKFYRVPCFREIGGFVREVMWDGIDCHCCRMKGWIACSWDEPEIRFVHLRPMGASQQSILVGRRRHGFGQYDLGTGWGDMTNSAVYRITHPPYVLGALCMWLGYARSAWRGRPRYADAAFRRFLRRFQWRCLVYGKARTAERFHAAIRQGRGVC